MAAASVLVNCIACSLLARYTQSSTNNVPHAAVTKAGYKTAVRLSSAVITCMGLMETSVFGRVLGPTCFWTAVIIGSKQNAYSISSVQFSSVTVFVSRSLIIKIMTTALTRSRYVETFQFSAGQRTLRVSVMSSSFPAADCSTLTDQRLKSFVYRSQLFLSVTQPGHLDLPSASGDV